MVFERKKHSKLEDLEDLIKIHLRYSNAFSAIS